MHPLFKEAKAFTFVIAGGVSLAKRNSYIAVAPEKALDCIVVTVVGITNFPKEAQVEKSLAYIVVTPPRLSLDNDLHEPAKYP